MTEQFCSFITLVFATLLLALTTSAQTATKIDSFRRIGVDETKARIQNLYMEMYKTGGNGVILIGAPPHEPVSRYFKESIVLATISSWKLDRSRVTLRFVANDDFDLEFWTTPAGSFDLPAEDIPRDFKLTGQKKPVLVNLDRWGDDVLHIEFEFSLFANFLKANPSLIGKVIIFEKSPAKFQRIVRDQLKNLTQNLGVNRKQLRFFHRSRTGGLPGTELWIVPSK